MSSILSNDLSIYLKTQFDCKYIYSKIINDINYLYNKLISHRYFPINFDETLQQYPIFPEQFNGITKLYKKDPNTNNYIYQFNLVKIQNIELNNTEALKNNINEDLLSLKSQLEKYSTNIEKLIFDMKFQRLYYNFDYIDEKKVLLNQKHIQNYNYFYNILGNSDSLDCNIIENMILMIIINLIFFYKNTFYIDFNNYFLQTSTAKLETDFSNFIINYEDDISKYLTIFITNYIFKMLNPSENIIEEIQTFIKTDVLPKFISCFSNFAAGYRKGKKIISLSTLTYLRNYLSYFIYLDLTTNNNLFINDYIINRTNINYVFNDEKLYNQYINKVQKHNIQKYLNLSYLYKNKPLTYLNILSYIIKSFIDDSILPDSEMNILIQQNFINSDVKQIINNLINMNFFNYLNDYTDTNKLLSFYNNNGISDLCIFYFTKSIINDFINSTNFNNFIITDFLENLFNYLKENILVSKDFNWFHDINLTKWAFQVLFDKYSLEVFKTFKIDLDNTMTEIFQSKSQIFGEILINSVDGGNNYFEAQYKIDVTKEHKVYINNILIDQSQYIINKMLVIFNFDPLVTDVITIDYYPYYVDFRYDETTINSFLSGVKDNKSIQEYISQLLKNIFKGSITKETFNKILKYYLV